VKSARKGRERIGGQERKKHRSRRNPLLYAITPFSVISLFRGGEMRPRRGMQVLEGKGTKEPSGSAVPQSNAPPHTLLVTKASMRRHRIRKGETGRGRSRAPDQCAAEIQREGQCSCPIIGITKRDRQGKKDEKSELQLNESDIGRG